MSIWLWVVVFLTWCAFVYVWTSIRQFRELVMKNERLDWELRHAKKRLLRAENDLVSQDIHIKEQSEVLNEWVEALNEWKEAHDQLEKDFDRLLSVSEEWFELDIVDRRQYDSLAEVDDLLLQTTTKEFIRLMGWHRANKVKARRPVVNLNTKKDIKESVELAKENFKKIKYHFTPEGLGNIQSLIEVEKDKFLNEKERNTSLS
jgi:hypothetical protein